MQLFKATVGGIQLNAQLSRCGFLIGSRQRLLQTVALIVACEEWIVTGGRYEGINIV